MSRQVICRYIFILLFSLCSGLAGLTVHAQTDTVTADEEGGPPPRKKHLAGHQLAIGFDVFNPIMNQYVKNRSNYELELHYYLNNEYYAVAEGGWGGSKVEFDDLKYTTTNTFGRIGFNKSILYRESPRDWDMMFMGLRAAMSNVNRSIANYTVVDSLWGSLAGVSPAKSFIAAWAELTLGMRVELLPGMLAGWNMRAKFLMNGKSFKELAPLNIAGFGKGDKNANFDLNFYVSYAIRWNRNARAVASDTSTTLKPLAPTPTTGPGKSLKKQ